MAKGKPYRRLSLKLLAMLLLAAMAAIALGLTLQVLGDYLVERVSCSAKRPNLRLLEAIGSFRTYVQAEAVSVSYTHLEATAPVRSLLRCTP